MKKDKSTWSKAAGELLEGFEKDWEKKKAKQAEVLHNEIIKVIEEQGADSYTLLYVLKILEYECLRDEYDKIAKEETKLSKAGDYVKPMSIT
ncbi:MAG: hypothetical protein KAS87_06530 [Candidatus Omnitrophica bacterium]|nr:hypothetical protein [Candidatus Omnitrophota bacterium]